MKYYGQFNNPKVDEYLHKEFFSQKKDGFFIECGASDGITESSCRVFSILGWNGINIEPDPTLFKDLVINRPEAVNINYALTSKEGEGYLDYIPVKFTQHASMIHKRKTTGRGFLKNSPCFNIVKTQSILEMNQAIKIPTISYSSLVLKYNIPKVDLFVLDVEGSEIDVISGMKDTEVLPKVICAEIEPTGLTTLTRLLKEFNYEYYSTVHANAHFILKT